MWQRFVAQSCLSLVMAAALALGSPAIGWSEETPTKEPEFPDRFMFRGGWNYVFNADTTFAVNGAAGLGSTIDFGGQLGGQREDNLWRIDSLYRFNPRHSIGFSYYNVKRKGFRSLDRDLLIDDVTYTAGASVSSEIDIQLYRFLYNYSFHHDEKVELGASVGLYFADMQASFAADRTCTGGPACGSLGVQVPGGTSSELLAPLPTIGFLVNYHFTPRLMGQARFDWFYIETAQFKGAMNEAYFGLEYRLFKHFSIGGAYNRLDIELKADPDKGRGWRVENDWNTLYAYGALYF
jgi:hypothetical protein